jgi:serine/threonine-protein kinase HipA
MSETLIIQVRPGPAWLDAASLVIDPDRPWVQITADVDYVYGAESPGPESYRALSLRWPLDVMPRSFPHWPALLDDIAPGGAARRWWVRHLGLERFPEGQQRLRLLREASAAPIGHLRIKEAAQNLDPAASRVIFPLSAVIDRDYDFLDRAQQRGAAVGGATGAGGEAPKFVLRVHDGKEVWIDEDGNDTSDPFYIVKFPRRTLLSPDGDRMVEALRDRCILESEFVYYRALDELGVSTIDVSGARLHHGESGQPSLWMPRFDVAAQRDTESAHTRYGVESLYALTDTPAGASADHQDYLDILVRVLVDGEFVTVAPRRRKRRRGARAAAVVFEYVRRDLLNVVFGNPDNHGRNMAVLKRPDGCGLAPVYDFAPMAMDPEGITRATRWRAPGLETVEGIDWLAVCKAQSHLADPDELWRQLQAFAGTLVDLDQRLEALGLPRETLEFAPIGLSRTNEKLRTWGLVQ